MGAALAVPIAGSMGSALALPIAGATLVDGLFHAIYSSPPPSQNMTVRTIEEHNVEKGVKKELEEKNRPSGNGIQPTEWPTEDEFKAVKEKLQYQNGNFHFAVTGSAGCGKSSLVNAFRGIRNKDVRAAKTGVVETTSEIGRYPDPDSQPPRRWIVWYDIPGAGTLKVPDWQYFNDQGLFIFDLILLVTDARFTKIDLAILENCRRFDIPTFIIRSKANQHVGNILLDMDFNSDGEDEQSPVENHAKALDQYVTETRKNLQLNLKEAGLPQQKVYIVSKDTLCTLIKGGKAPEVVIDERELIQDMISAAYRRRYPDEPELSDESSSEV